MWNQHGGGGGLWGELHSAALNPRLLEVVSAVDFDFLEEALWVGTEGGIVAQVQVPSLARHCSLPAHQGPVLELQSLGEAAVALSSGEVTVHSSGGAPRLSYADEVRPLLCACGWCCGGGPAVRHEVPGGARAVVSCLLQGAGLQQHPPCLLAASGG